MIHPSAIISPKATIAKNVSIGPFTIIHDDVVIGENTKIDAYCELGYPTKLAKHSVLQIGDNSVIRSHSVFYAGSKFENGLMTGHRVTVRENITAGKNLQIGTLSDLQGDCTIGDYVRTHSNVHIGKGARIGNFVWIFPYVVLTNDPHPPSEILKGVTIADFAVISTGTIILPGVNIGKHVLIGAQSCVTKDVPDHMLALGIPAKIICKASKIPLQNDAKKNAYPWPAHFSRGYPKDVTDEWAKEFAI